jgi:hypothetical protein
VGYIDARDQALAAPGREIAALVKCERLKGSRHFLLLPLRDPTVERIEQDGAESDGAGHQTIWRFVGDLVFSLAWCRRQSRR